MEIAETAPPAQREVEVGGSKHERVNNESEEVGETCISVKSKRVGFVRLHSLELKFIGLWDL